MCILSVLVFYLVHNLKEENCKQGADCKRKTNRHPDAFMRGAAAESSGVSESTGHISITAMLTMQTMPEQMWPGITENSASFRVGFS